MSYELVKSAYIRVSRGAEAAADKAHQSLAAWEGMMVGAIAGSLSAAATTPLDVIKTRMMTGRAYDAPSVLAATSLIVGKEGLGALCSGIIPRVAYIGPSCAIFFMVYELVQAKAM